ncbi:hypothetical protein N0V90_008070 [Kalmusia sp. IMI 367209]|nr:hypothetical protein N0V90_008070 [Kalmusia sp. IMI 367209]
MLNPLRESLRCGVYTAVPLPAFYVNVLFVPLDPTSIYVGGIARPSPRSADDGPGPDSSVPFIRLTVQHLARQLPSAEHRDRFLGRVDATLKPHVADKGYDWEYSVEETSRNLWKVQGLVPPMPGSEAEKKWVEENRATEFEAAKGGL